MEPVSRIRSTRGWLACLGAIGDKPDDDEESRLQHRLLVYMGCSMSVGGLVWAGISWVFQFDLVAVFPSVYVALTAINMLVFWSTKRYAQVRFFQILISLLLPFFTQWVAGGFFASGAVMTWGLLAVAGSLMLTPGQRVGLWLGSYSLLTLVSGLIDSTVRERFPHDIDASTSVAFFVINVVMVSNIVFLLGAYLVRERERATAALASATEQIEGLRKEVSSARKLGQYTLVAKLGAGGMGEVYRARHAMLRRPTAIKLVRPESVGEAALARFEREVQLTSQLTHPNTIRIFDYGRTEQGVFYYVMELLSGADLATVVKRTGPVSPARVVHILAQATDALIEAHDRGLIHRDIKPANIFLLGDYIPDLVKVLDFGLAKEIEPGDDVESLTDAGSIAGTPHYMAPECITNPERIGARSDVYAIGCVAYYLLTGDHVFSGNTAVEVCGHHLHTEPEPLAERTDTPPPEELEQLVLACLAKAPEDRPTSAELLEQLKRLAGEGWAVWERSDARAWWNVHRAVLQEARDEKTVDLPETVIGRRHPGQTPTPPEDAMGRLAIWK